MIIPVAALVAFLIPALLGGHPSRLARVPVRYPGLIALALGVQIVIVEVLAGVRPHWLLAAAHVGSYLIAAAFVLVNRRLPGLLLIGLGAASNGVTIAVNGGELPARAEALRAAGIALHPEGFVNTGDLAHPHLAWLGDVFAIPSSWPLSNVFSVGDLLIVLGVGLASWRILGTRWTRPWEPPAAAPELAVEVVEARRTDSGRVSGTAR